jgi:Na+-transporting NADH:ubiquinone oxidoreductase subunit NqrC
MSDEQRQHERSCARIIAIVLAVVTLASIAVAITMQAVFGPQITQEIIDLKRETLYITIPHQLTLP